MINQEYLEEAKRTGEAWAKSDAERDAKVVDPEGIRICKDIAYTDSASEDEKTWHLMDLYYPEGAAPKQGFPVIVSIHGGGWFYGDKELYRHYCLKLASYGYAVVNFNYRLSPMYPYPAGFMDVCALMDHLERQKETYELDMTNLFGVGDSAGAQLLSQYCVWATSSKYRELLPQGKHLKAPVPKKVALNCGIYNMRDMHDRENLCKWYLTEETFDDTKETLDLSKSFYAILDYVNSDFPETYLMLSVNDPLKVHTTPMKEKLEACAVPVTYREWGEGVPADGHVFHLNMFSENGQKCNDEEIAFFQR